MSVSYTSIGWNAHKRRYDAAIGAFVAICVGTFVGLTLLTRRSPADISLPIILIRALGVCSLSMLHVVLWIGPACRLDRRFLPLLYNRRHLGVATFLVGLAHAAIVLVWYHGFGVLNPLVSLLSSNTSFRSLTRFPFELLGLAALVILFLMAATSHDFWLKNLSPRVWRTLHSLVYAAYAMLVMHVTLGALQSERSLGLATALCLGAAITIALNLLSARQESRIDQTSNLAVTEQRT